MAEQGEEGPVPHPQTGNAAEKAVKYFFLKELKDACEERITIINKLLASSATAFHEACLTESTDKITIAGVQFPDKRPRTFTPTFREHATMNIENRMAAINYLFQRCPTILKEVFEFGRLSMEAQAKLLAFNAELVALSGKEVLQFEVHPSTLSSWVAKQKEANLPVPPEMFSTHTMETVSIRACGSA